MKNLALMAALIAGLGGAGAAAAQAVVGQPAPAFTAVDTAGKPVSLAMPRAQAQWLDAPSAYRLARCLSAPLTRKPVP